MSVELPFAPVDAIIRQQSGSLRVSAGATEELARRIQDYGATLAIDAAKAATEDGRKTIMIEDFDATTVPDLDSLILPVAPVDRIARLRIDDDYRVSKEARIVLADILEDYASEVARAGAKLARHADRRTIQAEDFEAYYDLFE